MFVFPVRAATYEAWDNCKQLKESAMLRYYVKVSESIRKFAADARGATAIEYGLIAAGIAVAIIVAVGLVGTKLTAMFTTVAGKL